MVKAESSRGGFVDVEVIGIAEARRFLNAKGKDIQNAVEGAIFQSANFVQQEVQESLLGRRAEPKSVDTGKLVNSIRVDKINSDTFVIFPQKQSYPNGQSTQEVAKILEYGTPKISPRRHFRNTSKRTKDKTKNFVEKAIKRATRS